MDVELRIPRVVDTLRRSDELPAGGIDDEDAEESPVVCSRRLLLVRNMSGNASGGTVEAEDMTSTLDATRLLYDGTGTAGNALMSVTVAEPINPN